MSIRFAAIGFAHRHIYNMVNALIDAGAQLVSFYDDSPEAVAQFQAHYPQATPSETLDAILEDTRIQLIVSASIPSQRAELGMRALRYGKDFLSAKPGFTSLQQLADARVVQTETGGIYAIYYSERFESSATLKASELVHQGAIGNVVQTVGFGPHRFLGETHRPEWMFKRPYFGGIINDLASHQIDQFLHFTDSTDAEIVASQRGNFKHPQFPEMDDFGDVMLRSRSATGYIRVDWLTSEGLGVWGDVRLFILGTEGSIELRKNIDVQGRVGGNHLFLVNQTSTAYMDCQSVPRPFASQLIADIHQRTQTAMSQAHCLLVAELALRAELQATRITERHTEDV